MTSRGRSILLGALVALVLAGCGSGNDDGEGFGCQAGSCLVSFQGPGERDLSSALDGNAVVAVEAIDGDTVTGTIGGQDLRLTRGREQRVAGFVVVLTEVDGENVTMLVGDR